MLSRLLDVIIGIVFVYFLLSLFISGLNELFAEKMGRRGKFLRRGLLRLIPDDAVYRRLLHHPLVESLYRERVAKGRMPSYIPPSDFAAALLDVVCTRAAKMSQHPRNQDTLTVAEVKIAVRVLQDFGSPLATALLPILDRAQDDMNKLIEGIERWFNGAMDRVSGWYKEYAFTQLFILSLSGSVLCNVDTIEIVRTLWRSPEMSAQLASQASQAVKSGQIAEVKIQDVLGRPPTDEEMNKLRDALVKIEADKLPIGFSCLGQSSLESAPRAILDRCVSNVKAQTAGNWGAKVLGWLITALAVTLGAPFWFELLSRLVNVRGSGPKPARPDATKP